MSKLPKYFQTHEIALNTISNGELSDLLNDGVNRGLTFSQIEINTELKSNQNAGRVTCTYSGFLTSFTYCFVFSCSPFFNPFSSGIESSVEQWILYQYILCIVHTS